MNLYLLAILVSKKVSAGRKWKHGKYHLERNKSKTKFFTLDESKPITKLFQKLEFKNGIKPERYGQALQSFQEIITKDANLIKGFSKELKTYREPAPKALNRLIKQDEFPITSHSWEFDGGNPTVSSATNPNITYNTPGIYKVKLTAGNGITSDCLMIDVQTYSF